MAFYPVGPPGNAVAAELKYAGRPGERNRPSIKFQLENRLVQIKDRVPITPGRGCVRLTPSEVLCETATELLRGILAGRPVNWRFFALTVSLGDGDDALIYRGSVDARVESGAGNDVITTGGSSDWILGEDGDDRIAAGGGFDDLVGGAGADDLSAGAGIDQAYYGRFGDIDVPRTLSLNDVADDGALGEGDNLRSGVEWVDAEGSSSDYTFIGNEANNSFNDGDGDSVILGLGGQDTLRGRDGDDHLDGGADRDVYWAGGGDDVLVARDGEVEHRLDCADGFDLLVADLIDPDSIDCEQDDRG